MAVGKRLRFQIFRRDNFACRYCGLAAKDGAVLEVDHMTPKVDGGRDVPTNLITACEDCNSGKSDIPLEAPAVEDVPQADLDAAIAARALAEEEEEEEEGSELANWVHELEISAAVRWYSGFSDIPHPMVSGQYVVSFALALASGHQPEDILAASATAGEARDPDLTSYLPARPPDDDGPEEEAAYVTALAYLAGFIPAERVHLIWAARRQAGDHWPTERQLIRTAAALAPAYMEDPGRDTAALLDWIRHLPGDEGSTALMQATARWDAACQGSRSSSAYECPDEVLVIAVSIALGAEVPR